MNKNSKVAFTLVELLVVIAIIGILSGLIIVGMNNSVQQATIAKAQVFSSSLRDSLLMNLMSEWKFDDASGSTVIDSWNSRNGNIGGTATWSTNCIRGGCLSFNGSTNYVDFGDVLRPDRVNNRTIEAWINPSVYGGTILSTGNLYYNKAGYSIFRIQDASTIQMSYDFNLDPYYAYITCATDLNKWNYFVFSMDVSDPTNTVIKVYKNGNYIAQTTQVRATNAQYNVSFVIGGSNQGLSSTKGAFFTGTMDEIRMYNAAIPTSQIGQQYYLGLNELLGRGNITKSEYNDRLFQLSEKYATR